MTTKTLYYPTSPDANYILLYKEHNKAWIPLRLVGSPSITILYSLENAIKVKTMMETIGSSEVRIVPAKMM